MHASQLFDWSTQCMNKNGFKNQGWGQAPKKYQRYVPIKVMPLDTTHRKRGQMEFDAWDEIIEGNPPNLSITRCMAQGVNMVTRVLGVLGLHGIKFQKTPKTIVCSKFCGCGPKCSWITW